MSYAARNLVHVPLRTTRRLARRIADGVRVMGHDEARAVGTVFERPVARLASGAYVDFGAFHSRLRAWIGQGNERERLFALMTALDVGGPHAVLELVLIGTGAQPLWR